MKRRLMLKIGENEIETTMEEKISVVVTWTESRTITIRDLLSHYVSTIPIDRSEE